MPDSTNHPFSAAIFIVTRGVARTAIIVMLAMLTTQCGVPSASTAEPIPAPPTVLLVSSPPPLAATAGMASPTALPKHPPPSRPRPSPIVRFAQLLPDHHGWLLANQELWWTNDSGDHWRAITPALPPATAIAQAAFADATHGWLLLVAATDSTPGHARVSAMRTTDTGQTWQLFPVTTYTNCFSCLYAASNSAQSGHVHGLSFLDAHQGWILVNRTETMNSSSADLFRTGDGGQTWQQLPVVSVWGDPLTVAGKLSGRSVPLRQVCYATDPQYTLAGSRAPAACAPPAHLPADTPAYGRTGRTVP